VKIWVKSVKSGHSQWKSGQRENLREIPENPGKLHKNASKNGAQHALI